MRADGIHGLGTVNGFARNTDTWDKIDLMPSATLPLDFRAFECQDASLLGRWLAAVGLGVPKGVADQTWAERLLRDPGISFPMRIPAPLGPKRNEK